jgi:2-polyprenyl-6-methoxyphenol hydroxylase-like FAD-dependent oxidoreductase
VFLDRQIVLRVLFERLEDNTEVVLNSCVIKVDHSEKSVTVHCDSGDSYTGDVLVAADGVHSFIRYEMRRYADLQSQKLMDRDRNS